MALNEALQYILNRSEPAYLSDEEEEDSNEPEYGSLGNEVSLIIECYEFGQSTTSQIQLCR